MLYELPNEVLVPVGLFGLALVLMATRVVTKVFGVDPGPLVEACRIATAVVGLVVTVVSFWLLLGPLPPDAPEVVVRTYWEEVSNGDYEAAWNRLSDNFKCRWFTPCVGGTGNFEAFKENWEPYEEILVRGTPDLTYDAEGARLTTDLNYVFAAGGDAPINGIVFHLIPLSGKVIIRQGWLIDKTSYNGGSEGIAEPLEPGVKPVFANLRFCAGPCGDEGDVISSYSGYTEEIWYAWDYTGMKDNVHYVREWWFDHELWVSYSCTWQGGESGTLTGRLFDFDGGLHGGEWETRLVIQGRFAYAGSVEVDDTNEFWDPVGERSTCPDWE